MNKEFLLQIADFIDADPNRLNMSQFFIGCKIRGAKCISEEATLFMRECETTACIAGIALAFKPDKIDDKLGHLSNTINILFDGNNKYEWLLFDEQWPQSYKEKYDLARTRKDKSAVAVELLRALATKPRSFGKHCKEQLET